MSKVASPADRLKVSRKPPRATLDGVDYNLTDECAAFLDLLLKHRGWVKPADWKSDPILAEVTHRTRVVKRLPVALQAIVESSPSTGYRLRLV